MSCQTDATEPPTVELDDVFEIIGTRRRRAAIEYLREHGDASFDDLVEHVAVDDDQGEQTVRISLYQSHVPKLEDYGVVECDGRGSNGWVRKGRNFSAVDRRLRRCTDPSITDRLRGLSR